MTPEEGMWKQIEIYRRMTPQQRLQIGFELYALAHEMVHCSVRHQHPDWDDQQVNQEVRRRFLLAAGIHFFPEGGKQ
jgi:hypothetical protein